MCNYGELCVLYVQINLYGELGTNALTSGERPRLRLRSSCKPRRGRGHCNFRILMRQQIHHKTIGLDKSLDRLHEPCCSIDGWMTCTFMSFSTVFQLYQDDG